MHEEIGCIEEQLPVADDSGQGSDDEGGYLQRVRGIVRLTRIKAFPADDAELLSTFDAGRPQDILLQGAIATWLSQQAEGLVEHFLTVDW